MSTPRDIIRQKMEEPKKSTDDAGSMEQFGLGEMIDAARFVAGQDAADNEIPGGGLRCQKIVPPGSV